MPFSGFQDLERKFGDPLQRYFAANPGLGAYSGFRSVEHQRELFNAAVKKYGSVAEARRWVAPPGRSQHGFGRAADLEFNGVRLDRLPAAQQAALHQSAAQFGLTFPLSNEAWHVEPIGARSGMAAHQMPAQPASAAPFNVMQQGFATPPQPQQLSFTDPFGFNQPQQDWLQNTSYSPSAILSDIFAGRSPLRRFMFQKIAGLFS